MSPENRSLASEEETISMDEDLAAARALIELGFLRPAMTRLYYAVFHAARALLFSEGLEPKTHEGVQHLLNLHFIRSGRLEPKWNRIYSRLQKYREEADYGSAIVFDREGLDEESTAATEFCSRIRVLLSRCRAE